MDRFPATTVAISPETVHKSRGSGRLRQWLQSAPSGDDVVQPACGAGCVPRVSREVRERIEPPYRARLAVDSHEPGAAREWERVRLLPDRARPGVAALGGAPRHV